MVSSSQQLIFLQQATDPQQQQPYPWRHARYMEVLISMAAQRLRIIVMQKTVEKVKTLAAGVSM